MLFLLMFQECFDTTFFWAMRLRRRAIVNGAKVSAIRLLSLSHGKKIAVFLFN